MSLWEDVLGAFARAQEVGAAYSIDTKPELIKDETTGVEFVVRVATALKDKPKGPPKDQAGGEAKPKEWRNPFLPYEEDLYVRHLAPHHVLLLNKFNVVENHLLVVTRDFEQQTDPINAADFAAVWEVLGAFPGRGGLAFYNCGDASGHSQPHKHVQLVPLPFDEDRPSSPPPFEAHVLAAAAAAGCEGAPGKLFSAASLPFKHHCCLLGPAEGVTPEKLEEWYTAMLAEVLKSSNSWNLVMTRDWLMMVPRSSERTGDVALNALGFAGTLLVRSKAELEQVREVGPMQILSQVGVPP